MPKDGAVLQAALDYAKRGWLVAPLHWIEADGKCSCHDFPKPCESAGKHPLTTHGLKDATKNLATIRGWWKKWPQANVAIITGKESGLVVVDFDDKGRGIQEKELQAKGEGNLPLTPTVDTGGGGRHYFFAYNGVNIRNKASIFGFDIDIRGEGGYVVAPPSHHESGRDYTWRIKHIGTKVAPLPEWLKKLLLGEQTKNIVKDKTVTLSELGKMWAGVSDGSRNDTTTRLAGRLLGRGMAPEEVLAIMLLWNKGNKPPMSEAEVYQAVMSISQAEARKPDHIGVMPAEFLMTADITKPDNVVDKGLIPEGGGILLTGASGVGKSLISLEIAVRLSKGMPLWTHEVPKPRRVLFIQKENPEHIVKARLRRICRGLGVNVVDKIFFADRKFKLNLNNDRDLRKVKDLIEKTKAEVVVLDPLSSYHSVNENDNIQMRQTLDHLTDLTADTGVTWIVIHHEGKPTDNAKMNKWRFRGASSIRDWADTMIGYLHKSNNEGKVMRLLTFDKVRNGPEPPSLLFERDENFIHHIIEEDSAVPVSLIADCLDELGGKAKSKAELYKIIAKYAQASRATIYRAIDNSENRVWFQGDNALVAI